jgi:hypothetical protein
MPLRPSPLRRRAAAALAALALVFGAVPAAADPLVIDADGTVRIGPPSGEPLTVEREKVRVGKDMTFGRRQGGLLTLWDPGSVIGIQSWTMYFRSYRSFAWFERGTHADGELEPGEGGRLLMSLSAAPPAGKGTLHVDGTITGRGAVPVGAILMWSGDPNALPAGWVLCNGQNNTPDLRGMFVAGYHPDDADYARIGASGKGRKTTTMPDHWHGLGDGVGVIGGHSHNWAASPTTWTDASSTVYGGFGNRSSTANVLYGAQNEAIENRPPYYVLAYIMYRGS